MTAPATSTQATLWTLVASQDVRLQAIGRAARPDFEDLPEARTAERYLIKQAGSR